MSDLDVLRTAAQQREWNTLQDTLKRLLAQFEPLIALEIAATRVLPRGFETRSLMADRLRRLRRRSSTSRSRRTAPQPRSSPPSSRQPAAISHQPSAFSCA